MISIVVFLIERCDNIIPKKLNLFEMKKILCSVALVCSVFVANAQEKVRENIKDDYKRNSLSIVVLDRGDSYDSKVYNSVNSIDLGDKFDINRIDTKRIKVNLDRASAVSEAEMVSEVAALDLGKEILDCWFSRKDDGTMSPELLEQRGLYNADDQDVINSRASKVGPEALGDTGYALVAGSYVMFLDYSGIKSSANEKGEVTWSVTTNAHVYQIDYNEDIEAQVFAAWIYDDDTPESAAAKNAAYDDLVVNMKPVASVSYTSSAEEADGGLDAAIVGGYDDVLLRLEKDIPAWNVTTSIAGLHPLTAKIGEKEGVKNAMRFQVYVVREDQDGNPYTVRRGYLRATTIADNRGVATGDTENLTEFYQIAGGTVEEGMLVRQSNDLRLGVSAGYKVGGLAPYNVVVDYLASINTKGFAHYGLLNIGYDLVTGSKIAENGIGAGDSDGAGVSYINFGIGYGFGIRPVRYIELMPFAMIGMDYMMLNNELYDDSVSDSSDESFAKKSAWYGNAGVRANFNVMYPLQLFVQADYTLLVSQGSMYSHNNTILNTYGNLGHRSSLGFMAGVKWTF